ncbi:MAG TPA: hypothetical protein IAA98_11300 [Candidatus Avipropionibacterium avicola]|uniref:Uncharacterized protein n=1 Tax=Candidatus Avipropionibacterium avicola TaxID=2840701 RepID=A0A9D1GYJ1_9ACTN|nr:hypothetical protein [Candidatus Avipropionibacterium avicola]
MMAHPGVCLPITAVALVAAVTAAWFRIVDVSVLERFSAEGLDLRLVAIAFGLVGAEWRPPLRCCRPWSGWC